MMMMMMMMYGAFGGMRVGRGNCPRSTHELNLDLSEQEDTVSPKTTRYL
jgi:hypothetical protein